MTLCYLGLGSNLRTPQRQIRQTMALLQTLPRTRVLKKSQCFRSKACGLRAQPMFCNAVVLIDTTLPPHTLLRHCQIIEQHKKRIRKKRWGARTIDIDLLLYGTMSIQTKPLTIPHPALLQRDFVMLPLLSITPSLTLPDGQAMASLISSFTRNYVVNAQMSD
jgi:2-amino-4-hydroxy-6-hydroxymethyldihydropteridine diphosphokinase